VIIYGRLYFFIGACDSAKVGVTQVGKRTSLTTILSHQYYRLKAEAFAKVVSVLSLSSPFMITEYKKPNREEST
jgi:hypothetical protein